MFLQPDDIKSCANCKIKKVKCSAEIPQCSRCVRSGIQCNISDNVYYNHKTIRSLLGVIERLEHQVSLTEQSKNGSSNNNNIANSNQIPPKPDYEQQNTIQTPQNATYTPSQHFESPATNNMSNTSTTPQYHSPMSAFGDTASTTSRNSVRSANSKDKPRSKATIESISTEVGSMTLPNDDFASGECSSQSKFAHLILKQLNLDKKAQTNSNVDDAFENFDASVSHAYTPLPPYRVAKFAVLTYINYIHIYCPFLSITDLKNILEKMYKSTREVSSHDKFILFVVLSIGLDRGQNAPEMANYKNQFAPIEYYNTAYRYLEEILSIRSERTLQALLLIIIWLLHTSVMPTNSGDLWHLGRFSMSLAMELGTHRYNPDWDFGELKNELRNRLFWSTYVLERSIAMRLRRGVSLRKQAIDTPLPKLRNFDFIIDDAFFVPKELKIYEKVQFKPALMLIKLCQVYGDILETLYLVSGTGPRENETLEERIAFKERTQVYLANWLDKYEKDVPKKTHTYHELKVRYCIVSINLHRLTPGLPKPNDESILICKQQCEMCIDSYIWLLQDGWKLAPICVNDIVHIGLIVVYSCWKLDASSEYLKGLSIKLMKVMNEIVRLYPEFTKFKNLYIILSCIIIDELDIQGTAHSSVGIKNRINKLRASAYYLPAMSNSSNDHDDATIGTDIYGENGVKLNDWFSHELFEDVFRQYYFEVNDPVMRDLGDLFCIE